MPELVYVPDVARFWTEERRRDNPAAPEISEATVWSYHKESWTVVNGRYRETPMPQAKRAGKKVMYWYPEEEPALRAWFRTKGRESTAGSPDH